MVEAKQMARPPQARTLPPAGNSAAKLYEFPGYVEGCK
jgi:hypothetical protein